MRHALPGVPEITKLELTQLLTAQCMEKQRRQNGPVPLALDGVCRGANNIDD